MIYFVTGATGFIGKRLVGKLLARDGATVYFLLRSPTPERLERLRKFWHLGAERAIPIEGDILKPGFGVSDGAIETLKGRKSSGASAPYPGAFTGPASSSGTPRPAKWIRSTVPIISLALSRESGGFFLSGRPWSASREEG